MRLTNVLNAQHLGWHFKMKWRTLKRRAIEDQNAASYLKAMGLPVIDPVQEFMSEPEIPKPPSELLNPLSIGQLDRNENHPFWNSRVCHMFGDNNVLICGEKQAQVLTKTLLVNELPDTIQKLAKNVEISEETEIRVKNSILHAHLFDAHQEKLAVRKNPEKPMWVFPREWGITDYRKNRYIIDKLLQQCEKLTDSSITSQRKILENVSFVVPFESDGNLIQFHKTAEHFLVSKQAIKPIENISNAESELPNLHPLKSNISIEPENIYQEKHIYPVPKGGNFEYPHTAFVHYTPLDVKNITLEPVKAEQIASRNMLKAFTIAAAKAQSLYGAKVEDLPSPITVQCVQVHINQFYFGVYQLNTLNLNADNDKKNYWFKTSPKLLYTNCEYNESRPVLKNYNDDVLRHTLAFYQNQ
ncbi:39S ribosomal protein L37, mitochondrial [Contarinia nasturtii]|uniref:39S ribosomal protein L37, mitochondrial n=1 Tax=Contarinia nasturtii TaxID=265458 RepID=UPI0012D3CA78|nr:39S ribosomal protein L37, mitochondrial [Contarinia nasturtii]